MRIVILVSAFMPEVNGATGNLLQRLHLLSSWGHDVLLCAPDYSASPFYSAESAARFRGNILPRVEVIIYAAEQLFLSPVMLPKAGSLTQLRRAIETFRPDVIQVEGAERFVWGARELPGLWLARKLGVPLVALHHTNYAKVVEHYTKEPGFGHVLRYVPLFVLIVRSMTSWLYNYFDLTLAPSLIAADLLRGYGVSNVEHVRVHAYIHSSSHSSEICNSDHLVGALHRH